MLDIYNKKKKEMSEEGKKRFQLCHMTAEQPAKKKKKIH